jgi:hypothetical protein
MKYGEPKLFRKGGAAREIVKGKRWLLLSRWVHLNRNGNSMSSSR